MRRTQVAARVLLASAALVAATLTGCVERRYTVRTNVPGTLVYVNGEEIGPVPASKTFYYYGDREIVLFAPAPCESGTVYNSWDAVWAMLLVVD